MEPLIMQGVQHMAVGMGTVFSFLTILIFATVLMSRCIAWLFPQGASQAEHDPSLDPAHVAAITAAISKYKIDNLNK